ncbi:MAG: phage tail protein [Gammaproteobacteria bacterium]
MALSTETVKSSYPLPVYNYRVTILGNGSPQVLGFSEVSGLVVEYEPINYKHGLSFLMGTTTIALKRKPIHITLKQGLTKDADFLQKWFSKCISEPGSSAARRDILIDLCDEAGVPVIRWTIKKTLPIKLEAPTFNAGSNDVAIISMELIAAGLEADYHPS